MKVRVSSGADLEDEDVRVWTEIQREVPALDSPFFHPRFSATVAETHRDARIAVMVDAGEPVGFLPFQVSSRKVGWPIGRRISDLHGIIARPSLPFDPIDLVRGCGLSAWRFRHVPVELEPLTAHQRAVAQSPYLNLTDGYEAYERGRRDAGSRWFEQVQRKQRKIQREHGPLRFEWHTERADVFAALRAWKSDQRRRTGTADPLWSQDAIDLLERLRVGGDDDFAGVLSALYLGDECIAAHLGLRNRSVLHFWFPAYSMRYAAYSPGSILLGELIRASADRGLHRIELGRGIERYKASVASDVRLLSEGWVAARPVEALLQSSGHALRQMAKTAPLRGPVRGVKRAIRHLRHWSRGSRTRKGAAS